MEITSYQPDEIEMMCAREFETINSNATTNLTVPNTGNTSPLLSQSTTIQPLPVPYLTNEEYRKLTRTQKNELRAKRRFYRSVQTKLKTIGVQEQLKQQVQLQRLSQNVPVTEVFTVNIDRRLGRGPRQCPAAIPNDSELGTRLRYLLTTERRQTRGEGSSSDRLVMFHIIGRFAIT